MGLYLKTGPLRDAFFDAFSSNSAFQLQELKLFVTKRCNLKCVMCEGSKVVSPEITYRHFTELVDEAIDLNLRKIKFFGGEPTLRSDLPEMIHYCSERGISTVLTTNGTLVDDTLSSRLVAAGLSEIVFSIDSPVSVEHDAIRGIPGTFARLETGLRLLREHAMKLGRDLPIKVNAVVMKSNFRDMPALVEFCAARHVSRLCLNPLVPSNGTAFMRPGSAERRRFLALSLSEQEIIEYNALIAPSIKDRLMKYGMPLTDNEVFIFGRTDAEVGYSAEMLFVERLRRSVCCLRPWYYATVNARLELVACNRIRDDSFYPIGSLRTHSLKDLWTSDKMRLFRETAKTASLEGCKFCCYPHMVALFKKTEELRLRELL